MFDSRIYHRKYMREYRLGIRHPKIARVIKCLNCGQLFNYKTCRGLKFCSQKCQWESQKGKSYNKGQKAWNKGIKMSFYPHVKARGKSAWNKGKTNERIRGENNPNWKGGITAAEKLERTRFKRIVQKQVFERDNYTCQICGIRGVALQVDHIQSWAKYIELRFCIDNCRTLCQRCHYKITFGKPMLPTVKTWGHNFLRRDNI